ncbi:MAG: phosphotransferase [Acholeplasmataceae bacterium]|nr:phosphotransferase [Acholeplasmataceae bacterium]
MIEKQVLKEAANFFLIPEDKIKIKERLLGGMSNYTYVIEVKDKLYTLRILGEGANLFVCREKEEYNLNVVKDLGITNETIYFNQESGVKIANYIEGKPLQTIDYEILKQVSQIFHKIHDSGLLAKTDFGLEERLNDYEKYVKVIDPKYFKLKKWWQELYYNKYQNNQKVFCHGDGQKSNFVVTKDKLYIVDFEFSGNEDPIFDIAVFGNNNFDDALNLLPIYLNRKANKEEIDKLHFYRMQQALQWYSVASFKEESGMSTKLKIDFKAVALHYLNEAKLHYKALKE